MGFTRIESHPDLQKLIDCYWIVESDESHTKIEKIIPDGFTELIFHYGDAYRTDITGEWQMQAKNLLAGQISSYFNLENAGRSSIVAVKFKPAGITQLFDLPMSEYTDKIIALDTIPDERLTGIQQQLPPIADEHQLRQAFDTYLLPLAQQATESPVTIAIDLIFEQNGMISVKELTDAAGISERQLERLFKKFVGLSPKFYARVIRFNYIFELIKNKSLPWADIVYQAGYYDQSHFIRNFKAFTGEDPSSYYFDEDNMANFFLNR